jgi:hypothetical protein
MDPRLMPMLPSELAHFTTPDFVLHTPDVDDGGALGRKARTLAAWEAALDQAGRDGLRRGTPAGEARFRQITAPVVQTATDLEREAAHDAAAALDARRATLRAWAPPTDDPVVEARREVTRTKLLRRYSEASDRQQACLAAVRQNGPEDRALLEAVLTEPGPRELLTDGQRAELETYLVAHRAPSVVRDGYRAARKGAVALELRNTIGEPAFLKVGP